MDVRPTFTAHFVICLACAGAAFFAWMNGVPQLVWANDLSMTTSVIAALFVVTAMWLGRQAWLADEWDSAFLHNGRDRPSLSFGYLAEKLSVRIGLAGTVIGLAMQGKSLMGGASSFGALSTSLYTTAVGVGAASILAVMMFSLDRGARR